MDTISRESNSMLPVGGLIVGALGLLLGGYAAISVSKANKAIAEHQTKIEAVETTANTANTTATAANGTADRAAKDIRTLQASVQSTVNDIGNLLSEQAGRITKIEESAKKAPVATGGKKGEPVTAGPGEYVVKGGDTGMKIATAHKVSVQDLIAVNPGVNWNKLGPGQKIKLPSTAKK